MSWSRYLLMTEFGQRVDVDQIRDDVGLIRRELTRDRGSSVQSTKDARQDLAIRRLERENDELRVCVTVLMRAMIRKGILTTDEAKVLAENLDADPEVGQS
jgi:hypothetical protein